jgi:EpsI family protein
MKGTAIRLVIIIVLLAAIYAGSIWAERAGGWAKEIVLPQRSITELPMQLDGWSGESVEMDERIFRKTHAEEVVSRLYRNKADKQMTVHGAVFGIVTRKMPHPPTICYPASGWTTIKSDGQLVLDVSDGDPVTVRLLTFDMEGNRILVAFWFQMGDHIVVDDPGLRSARVAIRDSGVETWPALIKVMLQTSVGNSGRSEARLQEFASLVYAWTKDIQKPTVGRGAPEESPIRD